MAVYNKADIERRMAGSVEALKHDLQGLRTGRASTALLDPVTVEVYGAHMPLVQVATVTAPEPRMLSVQVWDKSMVKAVETAIVNSNLGLSPATEGQVIRLRIPELNEERRKELVKVLHRLGEEIKTGVRNIRRDANEDVKKLEKAKEAHISEDTAKKCLEDIQKLTDAHTKEIDEAMKHKEVEILKV